MRQAKCSGRPVWQSDGAKLAAMSEVVMLTDADCGAAGALVAARHACERVRFPLLPAAYEDPARAADLVRSMLRSATVSPLLTNWATSSAS